MVAHQRPLDLQLEVRAPVQDGHRISSLGRPSARGQGGAARCRPPLLAAWAVAAVVTAAEKVRVGLPALGAALHAADRSCCVAIIHLAQQATQLASTVQCQCHSQCQCHRSRIPLLLMILTTASSALGELNSYSMEQLNS